MIQWSGKTPYRLPLFSLNRDREENLLSIRYRHRDMLSDQLDNKKNWQAGLELGHLYRLGLGGPQDPAMADKIYRKSYALIHWQDYRDDVDIALTKGLIYYHGWGKARDPDRAHTYFNRARILLRDQIQSENAGAAYDLAALFFLGLGGEKDIVRAVHYYSLAADKNYIPAMAQLADIYLNAHAFDRNPPEAARLLDRLAHMTDADHRHFISEAQFRLGGLYYEGVGRVVDLETAYIWFAIAAASGHEEANARRKALESVLTMMQILAAQKRAREWTPGQGVSASLSPVMLNGAPTTPRL